MGEGRKIIHFNSGLAHQRDHAQAFVKCGFNATTDPQEDADIHVISGPYYAKQHWFDHPRVLEIDRAWWGDPDCISIGWQRKDGTRSFARGLEPRPKPEMEPWQDGEDSCLILADYKQDVTAIELAAVKRFSVVEVRRHPAERRLSTTLDEALRAHDVAIGTSGTSLFDAIRIGMPTICLDKRNECAPVCSDSIDAPLYRGDRARWLHYMSYKQFNLNEIGVAWDLLRNVR